MNVKLITGLAAQTWIGDAANISTWQRLFAKHGGRQTYLAPTFCRVWHQHYTCEYDLVLVIGEHPHGGLCAVMPLAHRKNVITGVGAGQAEYQGWLAEPGVSRDFFSAAIATLTAAFPKGHVRLKYVLAGTCGDALQAFCEHTSNARLTRHYRPILSTDINTVRSSLKKKSNRSKLNRLKRFGELELKRITDKSGFNRYMDQVFAAYDLRQGAQNDTCPFLEDPAKRPFHQAWFEESPDDVVISVLTLDDRPIAGFFGVVIGRSIANAIISHEPDVSAHSASKLHLYLLAEELAGAGILALDLTPGGDPWKERFATERRESFEFTYWIESNELKLLERKNAITELSKQTAAVVGITPGKLRALRTRVKRITPDSIARLLKKNLWMTIEYRIYRIRIDLIRPGDVPGVAHINSTRDLVEFELTNTWTSRQQFLTSAFARLAHGAESFTVSEGGHLAHYGWLERYKKASFFTEIAYYYEYSTPGAVLYDFFTYPHSRGRGYYQRTMQQMLDTLHSLPESTEWVYVSVLANNRPSRHVIEKLGFQHHESIVRRTRLTKSKWTIEEIKPEK